MINRLIRGVMIVAIMIAADRLLEPFDLQWIAVVLGLSAFGFLWWWDRPRRDRLDAKLAQWLQMGLNQTSRSTAIDEMQQTLSKMGSRLNAKSLERGMRLKLGLIELLAAEQRLDEVDLLLGALRDQPLAGDAAFARTLAGATQALRRGDAGQAESLLAQAPTTGPALRAQHMLLLIAIELTRGRPEHALERINSSRRLCTPFPSLQLQLRLYHAAALAELGQADESKEIVRGLDADARSSAQVYGLPMIRSLLVAGTP